MFYQANPVKVKCGRKYWIFMRSHRGGTQLVRSQVVSIWYEDLRGIKLKRLDTGKILSRRRGFEELYTKNGS